MMIKIRNNFKNIAVVKCCFGSRVDCALVSARLMLMEDLNIPFWFHSKSVTYDIERNKKIFLNDSVRNDQTYLTDW